MRTTHRRPTNDDGSTTVEYAIVTVAVAAFAAVLYTLLTGDSVVSWLTSLVMKALTVPS
jgi:Flp pilus assembly pilin Flp